MTKEELEPWTGPQRSLPVLVGFLWVLVGAVTIFLSFPDPIEHWTLVVWGIAIVLGGLFVLYLRLAVLPSVRKL